METAAALRSFNGGLKKMYTAQSFYEKPVAWHFSKVDVKSAKSTQVPVGRWSITSSKANQRRLLLKYVEASETTSSTTSDESASLENAQGPPAKENNPKSIFFPKALESLLVEVCDNTDVAELKLKVGDFEMHLKRDVSSSQAADPIMPSIVSPTTAPPIPSKPMVDSVSGAPAVVPSTSTAAASPVAKISSSKSSKIAALEASGLNAYVVVSSPAVGLFRKGRTLKGKRQPPSCKEGDVIKEGQVIGYLDQFGNELPVKSDVAGEVLKVLFNEGEVVGYGDPLVAVLPSFHGILNV